MMNEKIKELAVKAGVTFDWDPGTSGPEVHFDSQEDLEKFAESIVRECMNIVNNADMTELEGPDPEDVLYVACKQIKEHFGIEK